MAQHPEFGVVASRIARALRGYDAFTFDPITMAMGAESEVGYLAVESVRQQVEHALEGAGLTAEAFDDELRRRTSDKFAFRFGSVHDLLVW